MMKTSIRQFFIFALILSLLMSNFAFAGVKEFVIEEKDRVLPTGIDIKISEELKNQQLKDDDRVRLIVELNEEPVIKYATKQGIQVVDMDDLQRNSIVDAIVSEQRVMLNQLESTAVDVTVLSTYNSIFNGIAMTARYGDIEKIASLKNVKRVSISKQYALPEPEMNNSSRYTKAQQVNDEYGYKGEGIVVSIIDSGIDYTHQDMKVDLDTDLALSEAEVIGLGFKSGLPGKYYTEKVPYGYNYIDKNFVIRDYHPKTGMHGMHVAGTVGANGDIMGVAPNSQLLAMKVFSNDKAFASTYGDILVAAMEDSIKLGADVMNLSIGATAQWVDSLDPEQIAVRLATENGIVMSISAGNSAFFGNGSSPNFPYAENPDIGVVGSPGLSNESIQVASSDNYSELFELNVDLAGLATSVGYGADRWQDKEYELVTLNNKMGAPEDYDNVDVKGKVVLVSRGAYSFFDKTINAENKGAVGIIVYNNDPNRLFYKNQGGWGTIPFMKIHQAEGLMLEEASKNGPVTIAVSLKSSATNPTSGKLSGFSSWGSTPNLDFKPELTAPGGNIYSTLNDNKYGAKSGTSMAAPHVSGGAALIAERLKEDPIFPKFKETEKSLMIKNILMNTATPILDTDTYVFGGNSYVSVRQQGAGSMNLLNACKTTVVITEEASNVAKITLGEVADSIDFTLRVKNYGDDAIKYKVSAMAQMNSSIEGFNLLGTEELAGTVTTITVEGQPLTGLLTVAGKSELLVRFEIDLTHVTMLDGTDIQSNFPNGNYIEGFAFFNFHDESLMGDKDLMKAALDKIEAEYKTLTAEKDALILILDEKNADVKAIEASIEVLELSLETLKTDYSDTILLANAYAVAEAAYKSASEALETLKAAHPGLSLDSIAQLGTMKITAESDLTDLKAELKVLFDAGLILVETQTTTQTIRDTADQALKDAEIALGVLEVADPVDADAVVAGKKVVKQAKKALKTAQKSSDNAVEAVIENTTLQTEKQTEVDVKQDLVTTLGESITSDSAVLESIGNAEIAVALALTAKDTASLSLTDDVKAAYTEYTTSRDAVVAQIAAALTSLLPAKEAQDSADKNLTEKTTAVEIKEAAYDAALVNFNKSTNVYEDALPLSVPFLGFLGDFGDAPAFDQAMYESRSFYGMTNLVNEKDQFLGQNGLTSDGVVYNKEWIAMSPNNDGVNEQIIPVVSLLRNLKNMEFKILSEDKIVLRTLGMGVSGNKDYFDGVAGREYTYFKDYAFDGKVNLNVLPEGKYFYEISGRLDDQDKTLKTITFPFKIDVTAPGNIKVTYTNGGKELEVTTDENGSGIKMFYLENDKGELLAKSMTSTVDISDLDLKAMNVRVLAVDFAGNLSSGDLFIVNDASKPVVDITLEPLGTFNTSVISIDGSITDMTDVILRVNGSEIPTEEQENKLVFAKDFTFAPDGKHSIVVVATDAVNNTIEFRRDFFIDTKAPLITVTSEILSEETLGLHYVSNETSKLAFDAHIKDTQFPRLTVKYNGDVVFQESPDYESYNNLMGDVETTFSREINLVEGPNRVLIEAVDAGGNITTYDQTVYRLAVGEEVPTNLAFVKEEVISHEYDIADSRPVRFEYETNEPAEWLFNVLDSDGDLVDTFTFTDTKVVNAQWTPDAKVKTNGLFTVLVKAVKGGSIITSEGTFEVYNYPVKVINTRHFQRGSMLILEAEVKNLDINAQTPLVVVQLKKADGTVVSIMTSQAKVTVGDVVTLSAGIQMPEGGVYIADVMVWDEWDMPSTLSDSAEYTFTIN